jgi:hypothetical protein
MIARHYRKLPLWSLTAVHLVICLSSACQGFETMFTFQITDPSTMCTTHRDTAFTLEHHR